MNEPAVTSDDVAYERLLAEHEPAIRLHCYRMLGSYHDAEEATQETLLRAWRSLGSYQGKAPLHHWLHRIATTTCLMIIRQRSRRPRTVGEIDYLEPYPDRLLDEPDPATEVLRRDAVALAFIAALQLLPATQRAVLILRDVLEYPSAEVASMLDTTVAGVNSALQRARTTLNAANAAGSGRSVLTETDREVLDRFVDAWHRADIAGIAELLHEDAVLRMPPQPLAVRGRYAITRFFATVPAGGRLDRIRLAHTRANGHLALAAYAPDDAGGRSAYGLMIFTFAGARIDTITGFAEPRLFAAFGLAGRG